MIIMLNKEKKIASNGMTPSLQTLEKKSNFPRRLAPKATTYRYVCNTKKNDFQKYIFGIWPGEFHFITYRFNVCWCLV